ncbi:MAG: hypothetical protein QOD42_1965 [Sphingomonadales bacterium]|jgi:hypothetical protein|nr:hypothetical protein [Sphingomonadales bacterium]
MIAALFLSLLLQAAAPSAPPSPPPPTPAEAVREHPLTLFFYYRLRYFHDVSGLLGCARVDPGRTRALDARYDALHRGLLARFGAATIDQPDRDPPQPGQGLDCGMNAMGYDNALHQLERHLAETAG